MINKDENGFIIWSSSSETNEQSTSSDLFSSIQTTNYFCETYNDALFYTHLAVNTDGLFAKYRYKRAAFVFFCASAEAYLNEALVHTLKNNHNMNANERELYKRLTITDYRPNFDLAKNFVSVCQRFNYLIEFHSADRSLKKAYYDFKKLTDIRNDIAHYKRINFEKVYTAEALENLLEKAPSYVREFIKAICKITGQKYPDFYDWTEYKDLD